MGTFNLPIASGAVTLGGPAAWFFTNSTDPAVVLNTHLDGNQMGVQDLLEGGADGIYTLRCYCDQSKIVLDGKAPIGFGQIPVGFRVLTQLGNAYISESDTGTGHGLIPPTFQWFWRNFSFGSAVNIPPITDRNIQSTLFAGSSPTLFSLFSIGFGLNFVTNYGSANVGFRTGFVKIDFLEINGTYDIIPYTWAVNGQNAVYPGTLPNITVNPSNTVIITSPATSGGTPIGTGIDLSHLTVTIQYTDTNNVVQTVTITPTSPSNPNIFTFPVPGLPNVNPASPVNIIVIGDGTQFSGSVALGSLTYMIVNGSGIYVITPGKTADTLYTNSAVNNATADVKFPDPFIKSSFLP